MAEASNSGTFRQSFQQLGFHWTQDQNYRVEQLEGRPYLRTCLTDGDFKQNPAEIRLLVAGAMLRLLEVIHRPTVVMAVETMGIPFGTLLADRLELQLRIIRKHQTQRYQWTNNELWNMENFTVPPVRIDDRVILVDDIISSGQTIEHLIDLFQSHQIVVEAVITIFRFSNRSEQQTGEHTLKRHEPSYRGVPILALWDLSFENDQIIFDETSIIYPPSVP